jgi:catechol 2,3-dioxygenase-like lactoylglutathione lyase family enzyme
MAIPVLRSADLDRTTAYYEALGLKVVERHGTYLVMHAGPVELHFTTSQDTPASGQAFLHVPDAGGSLEAGPAAQPYRPWTG